MTFFRRSVPSPPLPKETIEIYLNARPISNLTPSTFAARYTTLPVPSSFSSPQVLVKVLYVSVDPAMRVWLSPSRSYAAPIKEGDTMPAMAVGEVIYAAGKFRVGDIVEGMFGWTEYIYMPTNKVFRANMPPGINISAALGVLGITGMTAYFGLLDVGKVKHGDVVVVSAAAGATGSVVAQIAKGVYGCQVIGIAGGAVKCRYLNEELGIEAVDYKSEDGVGIGLKRVLGKRRIDVYFDNVGGKTLETALRYLNFGARVVVCGAISGYNAEKVPPGPHNYLNLISYSASMAGFLLRDYEKRYGEARGKLGKWIQSGIVKFREDEVIGLENAAKALMRLFDGDNIGKVVVRVGQPQNGVAALAKL